MHGTVDDVHVLHAGRGLHLDEAIASARAQQNVGADEHAVVIEGRLEHGIVPPVRQDLLGPQDRVAQARVVGHQLTALTAVDPLGHLTDGVSDGEDRLGLGRVLGQVGPVDLEPEPPRALAVAEELGLGEAAGGH